jgi:uncharacterized protein YwqG
VKPAATVRDQTRRCGVVLLLWLALGCEGRREGAQATDQATSSRPAAGAVVLAGRPRLARLPNRLSEFGLPSLLLVPRGADEKELEIGESRIGGLPDLPEAVSWPSAGGRPLAFVAQFDLADVSRRLPGSELPSAGMLYFFYDADEEPWGYRLADRDGFRVIHHSQSADRLRRRRAPPGLETPPYRLQALTQRSERSFPDFFSPIVGGLELDAREREEYDGYLKGLLASRPSPHHRLLGHPEAIGGDAQTDCQLVTHGVDLSETIDGKDPRLQVLARGSAEWRLLLQLDSNPAAGMEWGESGRLYFFIHESDLKKRNFAAAWMIVQSD